MSTHDIEKESSLEGNEALKADPELSVEDVKAEGEAVLSAEHFGKIDELVGMLGSLQQALAEKNPDAARALAGRVKEQGAEVKKIGWVDRMIRNKVDKIGTHMETAGAVVGGLGPQLSMIFLKGITGGKMDIGQITGALKNLGGKHAEIGGMLQDPDMLASLGEAGPEVAEAIETLAPIVEEVGPLAAAL